ncbi:hypothetical protein KKB40_00755 [Patescibacteria group bacterium]|nr:hypothetical protein [Patescibacteria group bacterium]
MSEELGGVRKQPVVDEERVAQMREATAELSRLMDQETYDCKRSVSDSLGRAGEDVNDLVRYLIPWKGREGRDVVRMKMATEVAGLLGEGSEQVIQEFVEVSAYPTVDLDLQGREVAKARVEAAERVVEMIETSADKFQDKPDGVLFYPKFKPSSTEGEKRTRAVALAGVMRASMLIGEYGHKGADDALWFSSKRPNDMPIRYTLAVLAAYSSAVKIVESGKTWYGGADVSKAVESAVEEAMAY